MANNLIVRLTEVDQAISTLQANGWLLSPSIWTGTNATHPATGCRREGQTPADLIELAAEYTTESKNEERD